MNRDDLTHVKALVANRTFAIPIFDERVRALSAEHVVASIPSDNNLGGKNGSVESINS